MDWLNDLYHKWLGWCGIPDTLTTYLRSDGGKCTTAIFLVAVVCVLYRVHRWKPIPWVWMLYAVVSGFVLGHIFWP